MHNKKMKTQKKKVIFEVFNYNAYGGEKKSKNHQIYICEFHCVAKHIEG
jgi:hypothetical protein